LGFPIAFAIFEELNRLFKLFFLENWHKFVHNWQKINYKLQKSLLFIRVYKEFAFVQSDISHSFVKSKNPWLLLVWLIPVPEPIISFFLFLD